MPGKSKVFTKKGSKMFDAIEKKLGTKSAAKIVSAKKGTRKKSKSKKKKVKK
jgi:hypothetical protein